MLENPSWKKRRHKPCQHGTGGFNKWGDNSGIQKRNKAKQKNYWYICRINCNLFLINASNFEAAKVNFLLGNICLLLLGRTCRNCCEKRMVLRKRQASEVLSELPSTGHSKNSAKKTWELALLWYWTQLVKQNLHFKNGNMQAGSDYRTLHLTEKVWHYSIKYLPSCNECPSQKLRRRKADSSCTQSR